MMTTNTKEIKEASEVNLYDYVMKHHKTVFDVTKNCLKYKNDRNIMIRSEYNGFYNVKTHRADNAIKFLTQYLGYSFKDAVNSLIAFQTEQNKKARAQKDTTQLFDYFHSIGIPDDIIKDLIKSKLLYQDENGNVVFVSKAKDVTETHNTKRTLIEVSKKTDTAAWWFRTSKNATRVYICSSAVEAIALHLMHELQGRDLDAYYFSVAGEHKLETIQKITEQEWAQFVVIALSGKEDLELIRDKFPQYMKMKPQYMSWNAEYIVKEKKIEYFRFE